MNANRALCPEKTAYLHSGSQVQGQCAGCRITSRIVTETSELTLNQKQLRACLQVHCSGAKSEKERETAVLEDAGCMSLPSFSFRSLS